MSEPQPPEAHGSVRLPDPDRPPPPEGSWPLATGRAPSARVGAGTGTGADAGIGAQTVPRGSRGPHLFPGAVGLGLSFGAIAVYFGGQVLLQAVVLLGLVAAGAVEPSSVSPEAPGALVLGLAVASQAFGLLLVLALLRRRGVRLHLLVGAVRPLGRLLRTGAGVGLLALVGYLIVVNILVTLSGSDARPEQMLTQSLTSSPLALVLASLAAVVLAPLAEELLFRGLLHRGLRSRLALAPATALSSVIFALVHYEVLLSQPLAMVGLTLVGVVCALAYERTGSLVVPITIHAVYNGVTVVAVVAAGALGLEQAEPALGLAPGLTLGLARVLG